MQIRHQITIFVLFITVLLVASLVQAGADDQPEVDATVGANADEVTYRRALADHYGVTEDAFAPLAGIDAEDVAVVLLVARQAGVDPADVVAARRDGRSWLELAADVGLGPETFYTPLPREARNDLAALDPFLRTPRSAWRDLELDDGQVRALANLRFLTASAPEEADRVVSLRLEGTDFPTILALVAGADRPVASQC